MRSVGVAVRVPLGQSAGSPAAARRNQWSSLRSAALVALSLGSVAACAGSEATGAMAVGLIGPGIVNNPSNKSLRFDILKFGLDRFCFEMTRRGAPLKTADDQPVIGRFFASACQSRALDDLDRKAFVVQFSGRGFVWTNVTGRLGFKAAGLVEYAPDFQMHDDGSLYVYFRPQHLDAVSFETTLVEYSLVRTGLDLVGIDPDAMGRQVVTSQLNRGFTVIRYDSDGHTDFGLGYIPRGGQPFKPFRLSSADKIPLANDRTTVHTGQQDYLGGFEVGDSGEALYLVLSMEGTPSIDVLVVPKSVGDVMIQSYVTSAGPAAPTARAPLQEPLPAGQLWKRYVGLPPGVYYVVLDHSSVPGVVAPTSAGGQDQPARVDYAVQRGEMP